MNRKGGSSIDQMETAEKMRFANWLLGGLGTGIGVLLFFNFSTSIEMVSAISSLQAQTESTGNALKQLNGTIKEAKLETRENHDSLMNHGVRIDRLEELQKETTENVDKLATRILQIDGKTR